MSTTYFTILAIMCCLSIGFIAILLFLRRCFLVGLVEGNSMLPTLRHGDRVLARKFWVVRRLKIGHIVIIKPGGLYSQDFDVHKPLSPVIKRLVRLPNNHGWSDQNKREISQSHRDAPSPGNETHAILVPTDHIYVLGDNTRESRDSRVWGPVPFSFIIGVVILRLPFREPNAVSMFHVMQGLPNRHIAPPFLAETPNGQPINLENYDGLSVLFLFLRLPGSERVLLDLQEQAERATQHGVAIVPVCIGSAQETRAFIAENDWLRLPILVAPMASNSFMRDYGFSRFPAYCLIDSMHQVICTGLVTSKQGNWDEWTTICTKVMQ